MEGLHVVGLNDLANPGGTIGLANAHVIEESDPLANVGDGLNVAQVGRGCVVQNQHRKLRSWASPLLVSCSPI